MATSGFGEPFRGDLCGSMHSDKHAMPSEPHGCSVDILSQQSGPLSWVCLHNICSERWLSVLTDSFVPAGGRGCCCSIPQTDRQTHWQAGPTAAVGAKHPQLHQCCAAELCLSLFLSLLSSNVGASCLQTTCRVSLGYNRLWLITQTLLSENM